VYVAGGVGVSPVIHGLYSERILAERAPAHVARLRAAWMVMHNPDSLSEADEALIAQAARTSVLVDLCWLDFTRHDAVNARGQTRRLMGAYLSAQNALTRQLGALGLSPLARARIRRRASHAAERARRAGLQW